MAVKAQIPTGKRGKAGGVKLAATPEEAGTHARAILGMEIGGHKVGKVLIEEQMPIARELYAAVLNDAVSKGPLVMFSTEGGMDIEEVAARAPGKIRRHPVDIRRGFGPADAKALVSGLGLGPAEDQVAAALGGLYAAYAASVRTLHPTLPENSVLEVPAPPDGLPGVHVSSLLQWEYDDPALSVVVSPDVSGVR